MKRSERGVAERVVAEWLAVACLALSGCGGEVDPERIIASVEGAGRYRLESGRTVLAEKANRVACAPEAIFGVDYRIETEGIRYGGVLPIEFRWIHPELAVPSEKLWGTETPARASHPQLSWGESTLSGRALWRLSHPEERKSGRYEFVIRVVETREILLSHAFEVEGC